MTLTVERTGLTEPTVIQWFEFFREICSTWLIQNPRQIGGPGIIVQIDETLMAKRKHNVGHRVEQRWVFGGYCPTTKEGFLELIQDKSANTLHPLIRKYIAPGSIIHSDCHRTYISIPRIPVQPPYQHANVNHSQNFVDPVTGAHTNHVECYWKNAKMRFKQMCGVHNTMLPSHLDEFLWRERYGKTPMDAFNSLLHQISVLYPTP